MNIDELKGQKKHLERKVMAMLEREFENFKKDTGVEIERCYVNFNQFQDVAENPHFVLESIDIGLNI